uniref:glucuronosyltransferase n=1 Tax=Meloidogyne hapla TaxID=6305 RepID=A0A1I8C0F5_MELHA
MQSTGKNLENQHRSRVRLGLELFKHYEKQALKKAENKKYGLVLVSFGTIVGLDGYVTINQRGLINIMMAFYSLKDHLEVIFAWKKVEEFEYDEQMEEFTKHDSIWKKSHTKPHNGRDEDDHKETIYYKYCGAKSKIVVKRKRLDNAFVSARFYAGTSEHANHVERSKSDCRAILEAIKNGVILICVPFFGDQFYNAEALAKRGVAIVLDKDENNFYDLGEKIIKVANDESYLNNILKMQAKMLKTDPKKTFLDKMRDLVRDIENGKFKRNE